MKNHHQQKLVNQSANELANQVASVLELDLSLRILSIIYIPIFSLMENYDLSEILKRLKGIPPVSLRDLIHNSWGRGALYFPNKIHEDSTSKRYELPSVEFDVIAAYQPNVYERAVYKLFGLDFVTLKSYTFERELLEVSTVKRKRLKKLLEQNTQLSPDIVDILPLTLLEGLSSENWPVPKQERLFIHWIGSCFEEPDLFLMAALNESGGLLFNDPHGGGYFSLKYPRFTEIAETEIAKFNSRPDYKKLCPIFPNLRASRNKCKGLLQRIVFLLSVLIGRGKKEGQILFIPGHLRSGDINKLINPDINESHTEFYRRVLGLVRRMSRSDIHLKVYVKQALKEAYEFLRLNNFDFPERKLKEGDIIKLALRYEMVVLPEAWSTSVMELAARGVRQIAFLDESVALSEDYRDFLKRTSRVVFSLEDSVFLEIDNRMYLKAWGASYFYPFKMVSFFRKILATSS